MKRFQEDDEKQKQICAIGNFNTVALLSMILVVISLVLGAVSVGLDEWSRMEVTRINLNSGTIKTQGVTRRCVYYRLGEQFNGVPLDQHPRNSCLPVGQIQCSVISVESAHDTPVNELQNTNQPALCGEVAVQLQVSFAMMVITILTTLVAVILTFPLWYRAVFIAGGIFALVGFAATVVAVAVFLNVHRSYAGFFTVNGESRDGCLSYSFGLAIGSLLTNLMGGVLAIVAFVYAYRKEKSEEDDYDE